MTKEVPGPRRHSPLGESNYGEESSGASEVSKSGRKSDTITGGDNMSVFDKLEQHAEDMDDAARNHIDTYDDLVDDFLDQYEETVEDLEQVSDLAVQTESNVETVKEGLLSYIDAHEDVFDQYQSRAESYGDRADDAMDQMGL